MLRQGLLLAIILPSPLFSSSALARTEGEVVNNFWQQAVMCASSEHADQSALEDARSEHWTRGLPKILSLISPASTCFQALRTITLGSGEVLFTSKGEWPGKTNDVADLFGVLGNSPNGQEILSSVVAQSPHRANRVYAALVLAVQNDRRVELPKSTEPGADLDVALAELFIRALDADPASLTAILRSHFGDSVAVGAASGDLGQTYVPLRDLGRRGEGGVLSGKDVIELSYFRHAAVDSLLEHATESANRDEARNALLSLLVLRPLADARATAIAALDDERVWFRELAWSLIDRDIRPNSPDWYGINDTLFRQNVPLKLTQNQQLALAKSARPDTRRAAVAHFSLPCETLRAMRSDPVREVRRAVDDALSQERCVKAAR